MGTRLGNWNRAKWINLLFPALVDGSDYDGIEITITTDQPRHDAALDVGVMEADGSWYSVRNAIPLSATTHTARVWFDDLRTAEFMFNDRGTWGGTDGNFDQDPFIDRNLLARLAVGVVNGHGVGTVDFTVTDVRLASWDDDDGDQQETVHVTGETLSINGAETVPAGMFGWHVAGGTWSELAELRPGSIRTVRAMAFPGSAMIAPRPEIGIEYVVSGHYDRKQMLPQMQGDRNWREKAVQGGRAIGEAAAPHGELAVMEFWNEPYLDIGRMFERKLAKMCNRLKVPKLATRSSGWASHLSRWYGLKAKENWSHAIQADSHIGRDGKPASFTMNC